MIAFLVTSMLGMTLNMMIMFGLVLAVGVLVDDPIVVVEYAERKLQEGVPKREAFIMAARKMFVPVVSATFTTLSAFVVLLFWPGIIGKFMSYLPIIVIVVMCASLLSALVFMPIIGALIASTHVDPVEKAKADIVMYPDKFDVKKVGGLTGVYVRMMSQAAALSAGHAADRLCASSSRIFMLRASDRASCCLPGLRARAGHGQRHRARQLLADRNPRPAASRSRPRSSPSRASRTR